MICNRTLRRCEKLSRKCEQLYLRERQSVGNQIFNKLGIDADHILAELTKLERETADLVHEVTSPRIPILLMI